MKHTIYKKYSIDPAYEVMLAIEKEVSSHNELVELRRNGWNVSRRAFLKGVTMGGFIITFTKLTLPVLGKANLRGNLTADVNSWISIQPDGKVMAFTPKVEYGQGIRTGFAMVVAEEMGVPVENVNLVMGETNLVQPDPNGGTWGSQSTISMYPVLKEQSARFRSIIFGMAAKKLNVSEDKLEFSDGKVQVINAPGKSIKISEIVEGKVPSNISHGKVVYKSKEDYSIVGKDIVKVDIAEKVKGLRIFCSDVSLDGMLFGAVLRNDPKGTLDKFKDSEALKTKGVVKVVRKSDFLVVVAERTDIARRCIRKQCETWPGPATKSEKVFEEIQKSAGRRMTRIQRGDIEDGLSLADKIIDVTYYTPYIAHAPMETEAATAKWEGNKLTVWAGTQSPFTMRKQLANFFKIPESSVNVIVPDIGGAFGGKGFTMVGLEAAAAAKEVSRPVKIVWSREEEFTFMYFRPAAIVKIKAGVKKDGTITAWDYLAINQDIRGAEFPYECENVSIGSASADASVRTGSWRGVAGPPNTYAKECAIDELAYAIGMDPAKFRMNNLQRASSKKVLKLAMDKFGWKDISMPSKQGIGISFGEDVGSECAECVKLEIDNSKNVKVTKVVAAMDCGLIVNPEGIRLQMEGGIIMGLSTALYEEVIFENNKMGTTNFNRYRLARFEDIPAIECFIVDSESDAPQGVGELPIFPIVPAVANAYFDATGARIRKIPLCK